MSEWQPISTAPRDGQDVLIYSGGLIEIACFVSGIWNLSQGGRVNPTHWMSLPEPPK